MNHPIHPEFPWRLDTNDRYRDVVKGVMGLSTASLVLPIIFLRDAIRVPLDRPLFRSLDGIERRFLRRGSRDLLLVATPRGAP